MIIDKSIMKELREHLGGDLNLHRIAITKDQIAKYKLPTKPRKESELRRRDIDKTVEAEAMPVDLLLRLLREQLDAFLVHGALEEAKEIEGRTKWALGKLAGMIGGGLDGLYDLLAGAIRRNRR